MVARSKAYEELRVRKIRQKYGANAFHNWGLEGGNPVLLAVHRGYKVTIHKKPRR